MKLLYKKNKYRKFMQHKQKKLRKRHWQCKLRQKQKLKYLHIRGRGSITNKKIKFPKKLYLESRKEEIFYFISKAEKIDNPILDFSQVEQIDIGSALYIKAFYDFLYNAGGKPIIICSPKNHKMRQILQHIGVADYGLRITFNDIKCWAVRVWHTKAAINYGQVLHQEILPGVLDGKIPSAEFSRIASNLQELLLNCNEHAYIEKDTFTNFYLIGGEYQTDSKKSNTFSFCILDYGQGFKSSLRKNTFFDKLKSRFNPNSDSELLRAATQGIFNANKRKHSGRGTGLPAVAENVKLIGGTLYIYSDKGSFVIQAKEEEKLRDRKYLTKGSIIEVILPISEEGCINI